MAGFQLSPLVDASGGHQGFGYLFCFNSSHVDATTLTFLCTGDSRVALVSKLNHHRDVLGGQNSGVLGCPRWQAEENVQGEVAGAFVTAWASRRTDRGEEDCTIFNSSFGDNMQLC